MTIHPKDKDKLINTPNRALNPMCVRVLLSDMPEEVLKFYEENAQLVDAKVVIVRSERDEGHAANVRNSPGRIFFIFSDDYLQVPIYYRGVSKEISLPAALVSRVRKSKCLKNASFE